MLSVFWVFAVFFSFSFPLSLAWPQREQAEASESRKLAEAEAREAREAIEKAQAEAADVAAAQIQMDREQMEADLILAAGEDHKVPKRVRKSGGYVGPFAHSRHRPHLRQLSDQHPFMPLPSAVQYWMTRSFQTAEDRDQERYDAASLPARRPALTS